MIDHREWVAKMAALKEAITAAKATRRRRLLAARPAWQRSRLAQAVIKSVRRCAALKSWETRRLRDDAPQEGTPISDEIKALGGISAALAEEHGHSGDLAEAGRLGLLRRIGGLSMDRITEALASAGLIAEASHNLVFDAIDRESHQRAFGA